MVGDAKTNSFMLGTATVMLGPQVDLFNLNPADHSIGLVKNFSMTSEPSYTDLTQGVKNQIVYSVMTSNVVKAQMEVYEYTSKNLTYALGLDGAAVAPTTVASTLAAAVVAADTSVTVQTGAGASFTVGDWIMIREAATDHIYVRQITNIVGDVLSFTHPLPKAIPAGGSVKVVNTVDIGSKADQPFHAAKIVGALANGDMVSILIPKVRVTNGFTLGFTTDNWGNLPFEFTVYDLVSSDPNYAEFQGRQAMLLTNG